MSLMVVNLLSYIFSLQGSSLAQSLGQLPAVQSELGSARWPTVTEDDSHMWGLQAKRRVQRLQPGTALSDLSDGPEPKT